MANQDKKELGQSLSNQRPDLALTDVLGLLPDPDPVLAKLGDRGEAMLGAVAADGIAFSLTQTRKSATLSREYRIVPGSKNNEEPSPASKELAKRFETDLSGLDLRSLISQILDAPLWGMVPIELLWAVENGWTQLKQVQELPREWFGFTPMGELRFTPTASAPKPVPGGKIVLARVEPSFANPYGQRALTRCLWPVTFKKGGIRAWVKLAEDLNLPLLVGQYPTGTPEEAQTALLAALGVARLSGTAVVDEGVKVAVHEGTGRSAGAQIHERLQDLMDKVLARVITGQTLSHDIGSAGSRAASQTHYQVMDDLRQADMTLVRGVFAEIAKIYRDFNDSSAEPPVLVWFEEEDPRKDWADRDLVLSQMGVRFSEGYLKGQYGLKDGDFVVGVPQSQNDNPPPHGSPNSSGFGESTDADLIGELPKPLQPVAHWAMKEAIKEEMDLLGLLESEIDQAKSVAEVKKALNQLAQPGPGEVLAITMATAHTQGNQDTKKGGKNA